MAIYEVLKLLNFVSNVYSSSFHLLVDNPTYNEASIELLINFYETNFTYSLNCNRSCKLRR